MPHNPKIRVSILGLSLLFFLASCGGTAEISSDTETDVQTAVGTNGQLISIQSDNVRAAGYDKTSMTMTVQFENGYTYEYYGVPAELWNSFIAAQPHPWSQVGNPQLVKAGVPYKRIR